MNKKILTYSIIILVIGFMIYAVSSRRSNQNNALDENVSINQDAMDTEQNVSEQTPANETQDNKPIVTENIPETPQTPTFSLADVAQHDIESDCYTTINGIVYDLTAWVHKHPGGDRNILRICGIDGTSAYNRQHGNNTQAKNILAEFEIGILVN